MQNWVEFVANGDRIVIRPEYIIYFETQSMGYTKLWIDVGRSPQEVVVSEPYEQVKQKIMDAEKVDYDDVVRERFTREEYEDLEACVGYFIEYGEIDGDARVDLAKLQDKLDKILKEEEQCQQTGTR